jgi:phospholipid transport system substrate-binding protein
MPISDLSRRRLLLAGSCALMASALPAQALTQAQARQLVDAAMAEVQSIIDSGASEARMIARFEDLFDRYGDVPAISRSALGPPARGASAGQLSSFAAAFRGYMARKYGRQFRRFAGAAADVQGLREVQGYWEVISTMTLRGEAPFEVRWHVSDRSGQPRFFNLIIEGVNLLAAERQEIGTLLERRGGDIDRMTQDLQSAG